METPFRSHVLDVVILLVRSRDQIPAALKSLVNDEDGLVAIVQTFRPINADRPQQSSRRMKQGDNLLLLHRTRFEPAHRARELCLIHLVVAPHQQNHWARLRLPALAVHFIRHQRQGLDLVLRGDSQVSRNILNRLLTGCVNE